MNYLSLFSGIGAFEKAMNNLQIPFDLVGYSEIDKYASKSYSEIHGIPESMNLGDITKIDEKKLPKADFITYGFPCQDVSIAGKQQGLLNDDGTKTRSGLFFDALRIIEHTQPIVAIAENVKNLVGKKFNAQFQVVLASLESAGYNNYYEVLNSKDYGVPQNRDRVFIVSIRKDIDHGLFCFPKSFPLQKRLKDVLENEVDEKYYLSDKAIQYVCATETKNFHYEPIIVEDFYKNRQLREYTEYAPTIRADRQGLKVVEPQIIQIAQMYPNSGNPQAGRIYSAEGISPTMDTCSGGNRMPKVIDNLRVRKLTPKECFRLMGFTDEDFEKCSCSNTQLYKQAGNSIVVDVAEELLCMLFDEEGNFFI